MANLQTLQAAKNLAELKSQVPAPDLVIYLLGKNVASDGIGGFYRWDATATGAEDTQFMKSFPSDKSTTGRWVRVFQTTQNLPHGVLVYTGGVKKFYASTTTVAGGTASLNLTLDNTPTGTPIFSEIWSNRSEANLDAATVTDIVTGARKTQAPDLKTTTHHFYRPNVLNLTLSLITAGLLFNPFTGVPAGVNVRFTVEGI